MAALGLANAGGAVRNKKESVAETGDPVYAAAAADALPRCHGYLKAREELMTKMLKVMADHKLDAIVHKAVEHQPTLIRDGVNPPWVDQKGAPHLNTFLVFVPSVVVPAAVKTAWLRWRG